MKRYLLLCLTIALSLSNALSSTAQPTEWEKKIVATCLVLEAANQGEVGMQAVASVIANRAKGDPSRYLSIVKTPYAFSALIKPTTGKTGEKGFSEEIARASRDHQAWPIALKIVDQLYADTLPDNTFGADHYSRRDQLPSWSHGMRATAVIGDHLFFKRY